VKPQDRSKNESNKRVLTVISQGERAVSDRPAHARDGRGEGSGSWKSHVVGEKRVKRGTQGGKLRGGTRETPNAARGKARAENWACSE